MIASMSPRIRRPGWPRGRQRAGPNAFLLASLAIAVGCGGGRFDPSGPCTVDGRTPGAYPDMESAVATEFRGKAPDGLDSGRNCTPKALGSLTSHGVTELRFAGATWNLGSEAGLSLALLDASDLEAGWVAEFYETGARSARNTESVETGTTTLPDGRPAARIDALNGESYQTVVVWPDEPGVRVAVVASAVREIETRDAHEVVVREAIAAALAR